MKKGACLFLKIHNSIDGEVLGLINYNEFVKELMDYLEFVFFGKGNISRIFNVCKAFYRSKKQDRSLMAYFMDYKKTYEELNMLLPFNQDGKIYEAQWEQMVVMGFLTGLPSEYDSAKSQILSSLEISSFQDTFSKILRKENSSPTLSPAQISSALVGQILVSQGSNNT